MSDEAKGPICPICDRRPITKYLTTCGDHGCVEERQQRDMLRARAETAAAAREWEKESPIPNSKTIDAIDGLHDDVCELLCAVNKEQKTGNELLAEILGAVSVDSSQVDDALGDVTRELYNRSRKARNSGESHSHARAVALRSAGKYVAELKASLLENGPRNEGRGQSPLRAAVRPWRQEQAAIDAEIDSLRRESPFRPKPLRAHSALAGKFARAAFAASGDFFDATYMRTAFVCEICEEGRQTHQIRWAGGATEMICSACLSAWEEGRPEGERDDEAKSPLRPAEGDGETAPRHVWAPPHEDDDEEPDDDPRSSIEELRRDDSAMESGDARDCNVCGEENQLRAMAFDGSRWICKPCLIALQTSSPRRAELDAELEPRTLPGERVCIRCDASMESEPVRVGELLICAECSEGAEASDA